MRIALTTVLIAAGFTVGAAAQQPTRSSPSQGPTAAVGPCCPTLGSYEAAVYAFAHGDRNAATIAIARAPADQLKNAVSEINEKDQGLLEAAAVMHLVLGMRAMEAGYLPQMTVQLKHSDAVFQKIRRGDATMFGANWYLAATELHLAIGDFDGAAALVKRGRHENIPQAAVLLAEGIVDETRAEIDQRASTTSPPRLDAVQNTLSPLSMHSNFAQTTRDERGADLRAAEKAYRRSLSSNPTSEEARLRLGRVLALRGNGADAQTVLANLVTASHDQGVLYLAHLFLADLAKRQKDSDSAKSEYLAAIAAKPSSSMAYIGLSNLALVAGDETRARTYIRELMSRNTTPVDELWTQYKYGSDHLQLTLNTLLGMISR